MAEQEQRTVDSGQNQSDTGLNESLNEELNNEGSTLDQLESELDRVNYRRRFTDALRSTVSALLTVAAIAVLIATLWMPVLQVYGTSMTPNLKAGDIVLCTRGGMKRGNVVAFYVSNKILVKRVIGEGGDVINIDKEGTVTVNGEQIDESYVHEKQKGEISVKMPYTVPANKIFVLSDNREQNADSRSKTIGCVAEEDMVGRAVIRVWPLKSFGLVH